MNPVWKWKKYHRKHKEKLLGVFLFFQNDYKQDQNIENTINLWHCLRHILIVSSTIIKWWDLAIGSWSHVSVVPHLVEQWAVSDGNTQGSEASAKHHVIWSVVTVAATAAGHEPGHRHPAEHHPARGGGTEQKYKDPECRHQTSNLCPSCCSKSKTKGRGDWKWQSILRENVYNSEI